MCVCLNGRGDVNELALSVWLSLSKRTSLGGLSVVLPWPCGTGLSGPLEAAAAAASEEEEDEEDEEDGDAAVEWEATVEAVGADTGVLPGRPLAPLQAGPCTWLPPPMTISAPPCLAWPGCTRPSGQTGRRGAAIPGHEIRPA